MIWNTLYSILGKSPCQQIAFFIFLFWGFNLTSALHFFVNCESSNLETILQYLLKTILGYWTE